MRRRERDRVRKVLDGRLRDVRAALEAGGGMGDGGLAVLDDADQLLQWAPADLVAALRHMVTRLETEQDGGLPARLALTSALAGEGVTFVARSLAAVVAHDLRRRVCLVDLGWWGGSPGGDPATGRPGLAQVLTGAATLDEAVTATSDPNLSFLPPGAATVAERPVLAQGAELAAVLDRLDARFDHVVLDLPPVLRNPETLSLADRAGTCALVVRSGVTAETFVRSALDELRHVSVLGIVMNGATTSIPGRLERVLSPW